MEEIIVRKPPQKVDGICNKKKVLIYNDDRELFIYKKNNIVTIPGTDFESNESISDAVYNLMGININPNNLVDLIIVRDYIKTNQSINGKLKFVYKELQREYYSYYLNDSKIYPYEITEFGKLTRVPLEKLLTSKDYLEYLPAYNELNKRLTYQKY